MLRHLLLAVPAPIRAVKLGFSLLKLCHKRSGIDAMLHSYKPGIRISAHGHTLGGRDTVKTLIVHLYTLTRILFSTCGWGDHNGFKLRAGIPRK